ncbi:hypothetical protein [Neisseria meningitidis]|uniref:hypothetical protein n=1 Tax=Neisseria meningitidis TaxID=487 RepID=UPI000E523BC9|nr:hypothetical protein [Neisseria meningitidis]
MNELISKINRFGAREKDEQSLLLKIGEICRDAAATFTTRKSESIPTFQPNLTNRNMSRNRR